MRCAGEEGAPLTPASSPGSVTVSRGTNFRSITVSEPVAEVTPPYGRCHGAYRGNVSVARKRTEKVRKVHGDVLHRHLRACRRQWGRRAEGAISCAAAVGSRSGCWRTGWMYSHDACLGVMLREAVSSCALGKGPIVVHNWRRIVAR
jgi:hypothetical protein